MTWHVVCNHKHMNILQDGNPNLYQVDYSDLTLQYTVEMELTACTQSNCMPEEGCSYLCRHDWL